MKDEPSFTHHQESESESQMSAATCITSSTKEMLHDSVYIRKQKLDRHKWNLDSSIESSAEGMKLKVRALWGDIYLQKPTHFIVRISEVRNRSACLPQKLHYSPNHADLKVVNCMIYCVGQLQF